MSINEYIDRATLDAQKEEQEKIARMVAEANAAKQAEKDAQLKAKEAKRAAKANASTGSATSASSASAKKKSQKSGSGSLAKILNGDFMTKEFFLNNLNFIFFLFLLLLLVLGKGYYGKELSQDIIKTQKELDEATSDYVEAKAKLEEETRRYKLREKLEPKGLKETINETKVIRLKEKK